jgi:putative tryptophan/tyrosine transport system substrate-binding protein
MADLALDKVGFLNSASPEGMAPYEASFVSGLRDKGLIEGQHVTIIRKYAGGNYGTQLQQDADGLVGEAGIKVIAATGGLVAAQAALKFAPDELPVLFIVGSSPGSLRFKGSTSGPPRNAKGVNASATDRIAQRLAHFRKLTDNSTDKIGLLLRPDTDVHDIEKRMPHGLIPVDVTNNNFAAAFQSAIDLGCKGILVTADPYFTSQRKTIIDLARHRRIPAAYAWREYPVDGGLMSFGTSLPDAYRLIGQYAGEIVNGTRIDDLRTIVEPPGKLVIRRAAAEELGLHIPPGFPSGTEIIEGALPPL